MTTIRLANIINLKTPTWINDTNSINKAQIATLHFNTSIERGYVKKIPHREIAVECICAVIGRSLKLDIPEPVIARHEDELYFGCLDVGHPNLKQIVNNNDPAIYAKLINWPRLLDVACFDGWIGNKDRHGGNLLYDGNNRFFLIDHGLSLKDLTNVKNYMMECVILRDLKKDELTKQRTKKQSQKIVEEYQDIDYKNIQIAINPIYSHIAGLVKLLEDRLNKIDEITTDCIIPAQTSLKL